MYCHLGLIVSGLDEEIKNVDKTIDSAQQTLLSLLGNMFSYKCKVSQVVLLRGILKLSPVSPIAPLYFLLGDLPIEATLHMDLLTLFWNIWTNPQTKIYQIANYLLMMSDSSSLTWSARVRLIFELYNLPDPLTLLSGQPWPKEKWKMFTRTAVSAHNERIWREKAATNSKLGFLNVQISGLAGRPHPVLTGILTTRDVMCSRIHIKMLSGDYPCFSYLGSDKNQDALCCLCQSLSPHC